MNDDPVEIFSASNSWEASCVLHLLKDSGIEARIASNALEAVVGEEPPQHFAVPVWVRKIDRDRAIEAIRDHRNSQAQ